jgi:hypothetical protein
MNPDVQIIENWAAEHRNEPKTCMAELVTAMFRCVGIRGDVTEQDLEMRDREMDECIRRWTRNERDQGVPVRGGWAWGVGSRSVTVLDHGDLGVGVIRSPEERRSALSTEGSGRGLPCVP